MLQQEFDLEGYNHNGANELNTPNGRLALGLMLSSSSHDTHVSDAEIERPFRRGVSPKGSAASIDSFGVQRLHSSQTLRSSSVELREARESYGGHGGGDYGSGAGGRQERTMVRGWSDLEEDEQLLSQTTSSEIQDSHNSSQGEDCTQAPGVGDLAQAPGVGDLAQGQTKTVISLSPRGAGVGLSFESNEKGEMVVVGLQRDGPAEKSGAVFIGDTIVAVNGHATIGLSVEEMMRLLCAGSPHSTVRLDVRSPHEHEVRPAFLRQKTPLKSIKDQEELASTRQLTSQQLQRNEGAGRPAEQEVMKLKMMQALYLPLDSLNLHHQSHSSEPLHPPAPLLHHKHPRHDPLAHQHPLPHPHSVQYPQQPLTPTAPLTTRMSEGGVQVRCVPSAPDDFVLHMPTVRGPLAITRTMSEFEMLNEFLIEQYSQTVTKVCV